MSRHSPAALLLLFCTLCCSPLALADDDEDREREHKSQPQPAPTPPPAEDSDTPPYVPSSSSSAGAGSDPAGDADSDTRPAVPHGPSFCAGRDKFRYDYDYGSLTRSQPPLSSHRLIALRDCQGVYLEHSILQSVETLGNPLWVDRGGYMLADGDDTHEIYGYLAYTTMHGLESSHHYTFGMSLIQRAPATPLGFEVAANMPLSLVLERIFSDKQSNWSPADYELELAMRLELRHGVLRLGYQQAKRNNFWRNGLIFGFSLAY